MAYSEELANRVRKALARIPNVTEKKMFGGIGIMINGKLTLGIGDHGGHAMMVRVGKEAFSEGLQKKGVDPTIMRGREIKGYVELTEEALQTEEDLNYWTNLGLEFNKKLTRKGK